MTRKPMTKAEMAVVDNAMGSFYIYLNCAGSMRLLIRRCKTAHGKRLIRACASLAKERAKGKI